MIPPSRKQIEFKKGDLVMVKINASFRSREQQQSISSIPDKCISFQYYAMIIGEPIYKKQSQEELEIKYKLFYNKSNSPVYITMRRVLNKQTNRYNTFCKHSSSGDWNGYCSWIISKSQEKNLTLPDDMYYGFSKVNIFPIKDNTP